MRTKNRLFMSGLCWFMAVFFVVGLTSCDVFDKCSHQWGEWSVTKNATCTETGVQERTCVKCGQVETDVVARTAHTPNEDDGDCTTAITCSVCGEITTPANESHTGGTATCQHRATCTICGMEYGELASHEGELVWVKHLHAHYQAYACCYERASEPEAHTIVDGVCTVCGYNPSITVTSGEAAPGDRQVEIALSMTDNPGITGLMITVQYSSDVLELTQAESGDAMDALLFTSPTQLSSGCTFLWDAVGMKDEDIRDGEILILTFNVSEHAPIGEYSILLRVRAYDNDLNPITLIVTGGKVTIRNS